MKPLPERMGHRLSPPQRARVEDWWSTLEPVGRRAVIALCDERRDDIAWTLRNGSWRELPIELRGRFRDPEDAREKEMWRRDRIEYLNSDVDRKLPAPRPIVIRACRAHPAAREILRAELIPRDFVCPAGNAGCPFQCVSTLAGGRPIPLIVPGRYVR